MAVTIYDLAAAANVSISTVSKALNDCYYVSDETRRRVQELAAEMDYRPNARARSFAQKKNGTVLFAADLSRGVGFENPHMFEIITGIERYLDEKGYSLILKHVTRSTAPEQIHELMIGEQADGIILHAGIVTRELGVAMMKEELPHLVIGKPDFQSGLSWMDISHEAAGQLAANYLLDKGYRRICFLMGDAEDDVISARRLSGLRLVMDDENIPIETVKNIISYEQSRIAMQEILHRETIPEVILCTNNYLAMGCMQSISSVGLHIPDEIALMTFDNYPFSMIVQPSLTAVEVDMFEMGWQAARFMLQKIRKPKLQTQSFCTTPAVIEREST